MAQLATDHDKKMDDILHLLKEVSGIQAQAAAASGPAKVKLGFEWKELSDTLHSKLKEAKYFKYDGGLMLKYIDQKTVEVLIPGNSVGFESFSSEWMNAVLECHIITQAEYLAEVGALVQKGGQQL
jgi:hypothetical protein